VDRNRDPKHSIIVAIDSNQELSITTTLDLLPPAIKYIKAGNRAVDAFGIDGTMAMFKKNNHEVFLDLKIADIGSIATKRAQHAHRAGAWMITAMHTIGLKGLREVARESQSTIALLVGPLTTNSWEDVAKLYGRSQDQQVVACADLALDARMDGIVCAAQDIIYLQERHKKLIKVTPGIRPTWYREPGDDQARATTPQDALKRGSDYLVIGRPVTKYINNNSHPGRIIERLFQERC
jgi:orotidine-5'-phosphate decarboxylase